MDPGLFELYEAGSRQDEVSVIIRLEDENRIPPDVRVVSRFGKILTVRLVRPFAAMGPLPVPEDGAGVVVGVCDWGFDFTHPNFRHPDGTTRLRALWDQSAEGGETLMPYGYGRVYTREQINSALATADPTSTLGYAPSKSDPQGTGTHGTHVCDIAAGNRREPGSEVGLASASDIVFVHLARQRLQELENFGDSVRLLEGLDFVRRQAGESPLVAHFSAGMTGGPHDGTALFAQAVDAFVLERPGVVLVQSVGNYAASRMASHGRIGPDQKKVLHWLISPRDRTPNELEIWYNGQDQFDLTLIAPDGERFEAALGENVKLGRDDTRWGTLYHRHSEPNSGKNHIDIFLRTGSPPGRYRIELHGRDVVDGRFHAWIERDAGGRHQSHFSRRQATAKYTTNTICNSYRGIAVGAYDATAGDRPATRFSSRGPTADGRQKPELVAPGYRIRAARSLPADGWHGEQRLTTKSGTSMAAPFVTGTVALMLQAAGRPLSIVEVRRLLIGTADPPPVRPGHISRSLGYGYLNTVAAVEAARRLGREGSFEGRHTAAHEALGEASTQWAPRWIADLQPFEHDPAAANVMVGGNIMYVEQEPDEGADADGNEAAFDDEEDSLLAETTLWPEDDTGIDEADTAYDRPVHGDMSLQEEEEEEAYRLTELYHALGQLTERDLD
ncbi:MAG: S8 family peptidase [Novosphingobium sp.]